MGRNAYFVYILFNKWNTVSYIGVTNNLARRLYEHKNALVPGFTSKYKIKKLVYYEEYNYVHDALQREKELKGWKRNKKVDLIKRTNPRFDSINLE